MPEPWLYRGTVMHRRLNPFTHGFRYPAFFLCFPLDARHRLRSRLFSLNRFNLFSYHEADHGDGGDGLAWARRLLAAEGLATVEVNLVGAMTGVACVLPGLLARRQGAISLVASVAGYTGLPQALVYGPTKAALINFAEALYLDVHPHGIAVHLINPGFVDTPLTRQNDFPMPALLTPGQAAEAILAGMGAGDFDIHFPKRFTHWLRLLRRLPYGLRFRLLAKVAPPA